MLHSTTGERSDVRTLLQKLILEEDQFAVQDILPNTVPDPASLVLSSEYACPIGQVVMVPDCGKCGKKIEIVVFQTNTPTISYSAVCCRNLLFCFE